MEFVERGKTILFVTHDVNSVKRFCNRAVWLNQGELIMDGNTDEVTDRYVDFLNSDLTIEKYLELCSNIRSDEDVKESDEVDNNEIDTKNIDIVQIHDLRMYDSKGREIENIIHGEKVTLKASYIVNDDTIETPLLGVAIRRIDNEYICGLNTKLDNLTIPWKKGYNEITLTYPDFNLVGGEYYFDVGIFDKTGIVNIDYKAKIRSFFVKMDYIAEGVVVLNHSWNVE